MHVQNTESKTSGTVFKIQRHSLHDGPGIRTLVFLKGCPLSCIWCFNPESQVQNPEVVHVGERCISCKLCMSVCRESGAISFENGLIQHNKNICVNCGECVAVCPSSAMVQIGETMSAQSVVEIIERDKVFYEKSGGGVTLSGGEVSLQASFAAEILKESKIRGINTAIETCGFASWNTLQSVLQFTDLVLYDLKVVDADKHKQYTGVSNRTILENLRRISALGLNVIIRIPVIPGCNDSENDLCETIAFISELPHYSAVHLLPYELFGITKYTRLGREYFVGTTPPPSEERMSEIAALFSAQLQNVQIGG